MHRKHLLSTPLIALFMMITTAAFAKEHLVDQQSKSFRMTGQKIETMTINAGDTIRFKNEDPFFHNIFSLSDLKTFDLGSFPKGQSKTVNFDTAGKVEVECAIHPEMYMEVTVK